MLLRETGFTFNGKHSRRDMGLLYAEKDGHTIIPQIKRNSYEIAGVSGTVLMEGEQWGIIPIEGTLYPAIERGTQGEAQDLLRRVAVWLTAGRCRMIFDYEPNVFYLAELSAASKWSLKNWFGGELPVKFDAQPFAYNVTENTATVNTTGPTAAIGLNVNTGQPAPLALDVKNTGTAPITGVQIAVNGRGVGVRMAGMNLQSGQTLTISMEPPIGAQIGNDGGGTAANALPYAASFAPLFMHSGGNSITVALTYGSGGKGAQLTARARGRW